MSLLDARQHVTNPDGRFKVPKADIKGKAAHHSVSGGSFFMAGETTEQDEINHIRMIDIYHESIDYGGFAYHACAFASGRAYQTGDFDGARAHVWGRNHELLGWVLIGNYASQLPSNGGLTACAECERAFDAYLGRQVPLKGHTDWALAGHGTACPGRVRERLTTIRNLAKEDDVDEETVKRLIAEHKAEAINHSDALFRDEVNHLIQESHKERDKKVARTANALAEHSADAAKHSGSGPQKVRFPGATIQVPPIDMPVEDA